MAGIRTPDLTSSSSLTSIVGNKEISTGVFNTVKTPVESLAAQIQAITGVLRSVVRVKSRSLSTPPASPANYDTYIVGAAPTGDWAGHANDIAIWTGAWAFTTPTAGSTAVIDGEHIFLYFAGTAWLVLDPTEGHLNVNWFGADPTGVADSTTAVQAALNAASPGMTVYAPGIYYVGNLTIPNHVTLLGPLGYPDALITAFVGTLQNPYDWKGQFRQKIGTTITAGQGSVFRNCLFIREGLTLPVTTPTGATTLLTQMSGTGISVVSASVEFDHVAMFGHNFPIISINPGGVAISNRVKIYNSIFDNLNGPFLADSGDPAYVEYNHIFSALTMGVPDIGPPGTTKAIYERPGTGLRLDNHLTESRISNNVIFGYVIGINGTALSQNQVVGNRVEFPPSDTLNSTGISIVGSYDKIDRNFVIGFTYPYVVSSGTEPDGNNINIVTNNAAVCKPLGGQGGASAQGFRIDAGRFVLSENQIQNCNGGPGIRVQAAVLGGRIGYNVYSNTPVKLENNSTGPIVVDGFSTTPTVTAAYAVLASDRSVTCNGAASITLTLPAAADYPGRKLTVRTIAAFTVVSASSNVVPLAGGAAGTAILPATAGKWAELESDGTNWKIIAEGAVLGSAALENTGTSGHTIPFLDVANTWGQPQTFSAAPIFSTLTGYLKGNGAGALTAAATVPSADFADGNTGTGNVAHAISPVFVTPTLGAATATSISVGGNQVVGARVAGWGAPTGTLDRTALAAYAGQTVSAAYVQAEAQATDNAVKKVSQELAALITDLRAHGLIGT